LASKAFEFRVIGVDGRTPELGAAQAVLALRAPRFGSQHPDVYLNFWSSLLYAQSDSQICLAYLEPQIFCVLI
jgi:hypothetical protein